MRFLAGKLNPCPVTKFEQVEAESVYECTATAFVDVEIRDSCASCA